MNLIRKFFHLPFKEKFLFVKTVFLLTSYRIRLKTTSLQKLLTFVNNDSLKISRIKASHRIAPERLTRIIIGASRIVPYSTCLSIALAGKILFAANGYKTQFHIGVYKNSATPLEAHAWLSLNGSTILGHLPNLDQYKPFPCFSSKDST